MRYQGKITNWNDEKGYGFVEPNSGGNRAFVHIKSFSKRLRRPIDGDLIVYSLVKEKHGRYRASNVSFPKPQKSRVKPKGNQRTIGSVFTLGFCVFLVSVTIVGKLPVLLLALYVLASALAFLVYAMDKYAAKNDRWRTKESTLHFFGLFGGWPGAFLAQNMLRHKSKKVKFQTVFWVTVALNVGAILFLFTENGAKYIAFIEGYYPDHNVFLL